MAGNKNSGRPATPHPLKVLRGTARADRVTGLPDEADGKPEKPRFQDHKASAFWDSEVEPLIAAGVAKRRDAPALQTMCEVYGLYVYCYELSLIEPSNKDARIATKTWLDGWTAIAAKFGMNPSDRQRIKAEPDKPKDANPKAKFFGAS